MANKPKSRKARSSGTPLTAVSPHKHRWRVAVDDQPRALRTANSKRWQLQEAKAKFSEVFSRALTDGPQVVTRRNTESVVILPETEYKKLKRKFANRSPSLIEALLAMPRVPGFKIPERGKNDVVPRDPPIFD